MPLLWYINTKMYNESKGEKLLSFNKVYKHLENNLYEISKLFTNSDHSHQCNYIKKLYQLCEKKYVLEKRKNKTSFYDLLKIL